MNKNIVWISSKCDNYYRLIRKIENLSIKIYEVKYIEKVLYLKVTKNDYEKISKYIISYKFKIVRNTGINKLIENIKQEKIFVISLVVGFLVFLCLKNLIVKVNIVHENGNIRELIKDELDENGIKVLSFKKSYKKLDEIRQKILDKHPDKLDWMEFEVRGMVINVKIEERIITDIKKNDRVCDIVAKKNGVINEIKIEQGEGLVNINDYVKEGDLLIRGSVKYNEEEYDLSDDTTKKFVKALKKLDKIQDEIHDSNLTAIAFTSDGDMYHIKIAAGEYSENDIAIEGACYGNAKNLIHLLEKQE